MRLAIIATVLALFPGVGKSATSNPRRPGHVVRAELRLQEALAPQSVAFELKLRNFDELCRRISNGEVLSLPEMTERYFPTPEEWKNVAQWAAVNGYSVRPPDSTRMTVFAEGSVVQTEKALHIRFARVIGTDGAEYTAAVDSPILPEEIGNVVRQVRRLHPEVRPGPPPIDWNAHVIHPVPNTTALLPETLRQLYRADEVPYDGTGETIVVVGAAAIQAADLPTFWANCGLPTTRAQVTEVHPSPPWSGSDAEAWEIEGTMDIEWVTAMAPRAKVIYISTLDAAEFATIVMNRLGTDPSIHQLNASVAYSEAAYVSPPVDSQYYAALAALGVTCFVASGDGGSNGNYYRTGAGPDGTFWYDPDDDLAPAYPASDPFVTAVGGTAIGFTTFDGLDFTLPYREGGWCLPDPPIVAFPGKPGNWAFTASTGGKSIFFAAPEWQRLAGLPGGGKRCVPDVAAMSVGFPGAYGYFHGEKFDYTGFGGTSMSSPVWAGLCALINQARGKIGFGPVGLLGPRIYPLMGTTAFNAISGGSGNNGVSFSETANIGAYRVTPNYNFVTGLGSPNMAELIGALTKSHAPVMAVQPTSQSAHAGQTAAFVAAAIGDPSPQLKWRLNGVPLADGALADGTIVSGSSTNQLQLAHVSPAANGATVALAASNSSGVVVSATVTLSVDAPPVFSQQPLAQTVPAGATAVFTAAAFGLPAPSYRWFRNNIPLTDQGNVSGATTSTLTIAKTAIENAGTYNVVATNPVGVATSNSVVLTVVTAPVFTFDPQPQTVDAGTTVTLKTTASGGPGLTFRWYQNGIPLDDTATLAGTATAALTIKNATSANAGNYTVVATTLAGQATSAPIVLTVAPAAWLTNLSARTNLAAGQVMIVGFSVAGGTEPIVIRGAGPALAASFPQFFTPDSVLPDPRLELHRRNEPLAVASNDDWENSLEATFTSVGAFRFVPGSKDAAFVPALSGSDNTVWVQGPGTGHVLIEAYAPASSTNWPRLTNLSSRNFVRSSDSLIVGFVIKGTGMKRLLIRAVGPGLTPYGVTNVLPNPKLNIYNAASILIAENDDWDLGLKNTFTAAGAFGLPDGSRDAALMVTLAADAAYTVQIEGAPGEVGEALAEVYELP